MLNTTVSLLRCPRRIRTSARPSNRAVATRACSGVLELRPEAEKKRKSSAPRQGIFDVIAGELICVECRSRFPILSGVAILVDDVSGYFLNHVKGIARLVSDKDIPEEHRPAFRQAKSKIEVEHIEEDLEAQRVISLYLMNHYLRANPPPADPWWKSRSAPPSPIIDELIRAHWDQGPFEKIREWVTQLATRSAQGKVGSAVELGCGVGGLYPILKPSIRSYLGVDSSFASVALARHVSLGAPYSGQIGIPEDLLAGPVARKIPLPVASSFDGSGDFVVGELESPPLEMGSWDLSLVLNAIDMIDDPASLPKLQYELLRSGAIAIQSGPYIWHEFVARRLSRRLPVPLRRDSARAVEWLYEQAGFTIQDQIEHVPWLFLKHVRQLEIYSAHLIKSKKSDKNPA